MACAALYASRGTRLGRVVIYLGLVSELSRKREPLDREVNSNLT